MEKSRLASSFSGLCNCECKLNEIKQLIKVAAPPPSPGEKLIEILGRFVARNVLI